MKRQKKGSREALLLVGPHETTKNHDTKNAERQQKDADASMHFGHADPVQSWGALDRCGGYMSPRVSPLGYETDDR